MYLIDEAIASHPDAPPDALRAIAEARRENMYPILAAHILAHPATTDAVADEVAAAPDPVTALTSPLLTDHTRARVAAASTLPSLLMHLADTPDAHPGVHTDIDRRLAAAARSGEDVTRIYVTVMRHPSVPDDVHLAAITHILSQPEPTVQHHGETELFLTHATRHPTHLRALARAQRDANATTMGPAPTNDVADALEMYAALADAGTDPRAHRLAALTSQARTSGNWRPAIRYGADPDVALAALRMSPPQHIVDQIADTPELRGTAAWFHAKTHQRTGAPVIDLDTARTYTVVDVDRTYLDPVPTLDIINSLSHVRPTLTTDVVAAAVREIRRLLGPKPVAPSCLVTTARLALHPHTTAPDRTHLAAALTRHGRREPAYQTVAAIAGAPDPVAAAAHTPLPALGEAARLVLADDHLIALLRATLAPYLNDPAALTATLALAHTFPGTLRELLDTVTTVTT